jgi:hypothetical protein
MRAVVIGATGGTALKAAGASVTQLGRQTAPALDLVD